MHYLKLKKIRSKVFPYVRNFGFVLSEDIRYVDSSEIAQTIFWKAEASPRDWLTTELIIGSRGMLDTLQNLQYWNNTIIDLDGSKKDSIVFSEDTMWGYLLLNYSSQVNMGELKRLARLKFPHRIENRVWEQMRTQNNIAENNRIPKDLKRLGREKIEKEYQRMKDWFWKRGIVMVRVNGTC